MTPTPELDLHYVIGRFTSDKKWAVSEYPDAYRTAALDAIEWTLKYVAAVNAAEQPASPETNGAEWFLDKLVVKSRLKNHSKRVAAVMYASEGQTLVTSHNASVKAARKAQEARDG